MNNAVSSAIGGPGASIEIDRRAGRIHGLTLWRRPILALDLSGVGVNPDDRSFAGNCDRKIVESFDLARQRQRVVRYAHLPENLSRQEVRIQCVGPASRKR